jgi:hypothetical protein
VVCYFLKKVAISDGGIDDIREAQACVSLVVE